MMTFSSYFVVILAVFITCSYTWQPRSLPWSQTEQRYVKEETFYKFWERVVLEKIIIKDYDTWFKKFKRNPPSLQQAIGSQLLCPVTQSIVAPGNVNRLTPGDIKVVAALGDSITAGFGAKSQNLSNLYVEYRDVAWSIGGRGKLEESTTLPNILKKYNPFVVGFSDQITSVQDFKKKFSAFNFARSGETAEGMKERIEELISEMKESKQINFKRDWKLITIWIGSADLCMSCFDQDYAPKNFVKKVSKSLEKIQEKIPRVFVNLVQVFDVTKLSGPNGLNGPYCEAFHRKTCPCANSGPAKRAIVSRNAREYATMLKSLVNSPRFQNDPGFAVVLQPFLQQSQLPRLPNGSIDRSYFAPDCFHLSTKGHAAMATALWNNMLQPVTRKSKSWVPGGKLHCPIADFPYFFTNANSMEYLSRKSPVKFHNSKENVQVHKTARILESEKERKEKVEQERNRTKMIAVLATSGVAIVALTTGIVVHLYRKRGFIQDSLFMKRNYNTINEESTL